MRVVLWKRQSSLRRLMFLMATFLGFEIAVLAEQLPLKTYTASDGLIRDYISRIVLDSHGFLWFCTPEGLSRFDGYTFTNYGAADGLKGSVRDLLQARDGTYWIATASGLYRFDPSGSKDGPMLNNHPVNAFSSVTGVAASRFVFYGLTDERTLGINTVREDAAGTIWCGTDAGLYRLERVQGRWSSALVDIGMPASGPNSTMISTILEDHGGSIWIGSGSGLYRLRVAALSATRRMGCRSMMCEHCWKIVSGSGLERR